MAKARNGLASAVAKTNRSDFNALIGTSDRYLIAVARWAILPAWSLTFAKRQHCKPLAKICTKVHSKNSQCTFSSPPRFAGRGTA